jgi:hypothetical protein
MIFMRIGLPVVVFLSRRAGLSAKNPQEAGACFSTLLVVAFSEAQHP